MMLSILPPNATSLMRLVDKASAARLDAIPVPLASLSSSDSCPKKLLPWLAWALSVDEWNSTWDPQDKRKVITASLGVHKHKGTIGSVREAVAALGPKVSIDEWFDYEGVPGHFRVRVTPDAGGIDEGEVDEIGRIVNTYKNLRSEMDGNISVEPYGILTSTVHSSMGMATSSHMYFSDFESVIAKACADASSLSGILTMLSGRDLAVLAVPASGNGEARWAENLEKVYGAAGKGEFSETQMERPFIDATRLYGAFLLDDNFQFLMVLDLLLQGDDAAVTAPADVFQSTGVKLNARIYNPSGQQTHSDTSGTTEWVFSNAIGNWRTRNTLSVDDGLWGIRLGHKIDGNTPGPKLEGSGSFGFGNYNSTDGLGDNNLLQWDGVTNSGVPSAIWFRED